MYCERNITRRCLSSIYVQLYKPSSYVHNITSVTLKFIQMAHNVSSSGEHHKVSPGSDQAVSGLIQVVANAVLVYFGLTECLYAPCFLQAMSAWHMLAIN